MGKKKKKNQVVIEETFALIIIFMLMVAATKLFLWFSDNLAARHKKFAATRTIGGMVEREYHPRVCKVEMTWRGDTCDCNDDGYWRFDHLYCKAGDLPDYEIDLYALWGPNLFDLDQTSWSGSNPNIVFDKMWGCNNSMHDDFAYKDKKGWTYCYGPTILLPVTTIAPEQVQDLDYDPAVDGPGDLHLVD